MIPVWLALLLIGLAALVGRASSTKVLSALFLVVGALIAIESDVFRGVVEQIASIGPIDIK